MSTVTDHASRVHEFLLTPFAYPEKPASIELKETHISWVYLTDRYVYKQKKPVSFEFLDLSTLELRKHFCEQEVMLNRRFSPEVYLGVVPVSRDAAGKYRLKPGKNVVEWLIKMKRLDDSTTLEQLILNKTLTTTHVASLSKYLTDFYSAQPPAMVRSNEFLRRLKQHVLANRNDLLISLPESGDAIQFATNAQLRCLSLESEYFVQRVADGRVVDGHGDLRPEHVYLHRSKPQIIDCIEFNAEYRTNDVIDELAFLAMECDRLGNQDVGASLVRCYRRAGTDDPHPFLAAFYKCYRACVRAKVTALRAAQSTGGEKSRSLELSQTYAGLAKRYAVDVGAKVVIIVGGLSGTGKSTLASALQDPLAAELLQTDVVRRELHDQTNCGNGKYSTAGRKRVYDALIERIQDCFLRSPTLILDGTFSTAAARKAVCAKAIELGAKVLQVQCECPAEEARKRIARRIAQGNSVSDAVPSLHDLQAVRYAAILATEPLVRVDTSLPNAWQGGKLLASVREVVRAERSCRST